jgi:hypothetical protein
MTSTLDVDVAVVRETLDRLDDDAVVVASRGRVRG